MEATCFWLKLTKHGQLVAEFSSSKQPYEVLMVGRRKEGKDVNGRSKAAEIRIPDGLVLLSVPSAIHFSFQFVAYWVCSCGNPERAFQRAREEGKYSDDLG